MAYTVLARKYRSWTFNELVGQEAVATTLMNAIASLPYRALFNVGDYGASPSARVNVDGEHVGRIPFSVIDSKSELFAAYDPAAVRTPTISVDETAQVLEVRVHEVDRLERAERRRGLVAQCCLHPVRELDRRGAAVCRGVRASGGTCVRGAR